MKRLLPFLFLVALTAQAQLQLQIVGSVTNLLQKAGDTSTGPQLTTSSSTNVPSPNEFPTAGWVRSLLTGANVPFYNSTNIDASATNVGSGQLVYSYQSTIPISDARSYSSAWLTNNGYLGAVITTNTYQQLGGSVLVGICAGWAGGTGTRSLTFKCELYVSSDKTNWYGDWSSPTITIGPDTTNYTPVVVDVPNTTATNAAGFYLQRRLKITSVTFNGSPTFWVLIGTNAITGANDAGHITLPSPTSTAGNAYLAANNVFTGSNTIAGYFTGNAGGLTNTIPRVVGITIDGGGSAIASGTKGFLEVPYAATVKSGTILADQVGSIQIETWRTNSGNLSSLARAGSLGTNWLTSTNWQRDTTLTGWSSVALAANDILGFVVTTNAASVTRATLQLKLQP